MNIFEKGQWSEDAFFRKAYSEQLESITKDVAVLEKVSCMSIGTLIGLFSAGYVLTSSKNVKLTKNSFFNRIKRAYKHFKDCKYDV